MGYTYFFLSFISTLLTDEVLYILCVKSVEIQSFFNGPYFPVFGLNTKIYGPEKTPYWDTFHAVITMYVITSLKENSEVYSRDAFMTPKRKAYST